MFPEQTANFSCLAVSLGVLSYDWRKSNGHKLLQMVVKSYYHETFLNMFNKKTAFHNLAIPDVQPSDEGYYCCVVDNERGNTMKCAWLEVTGKVNLLYFSLNCNHTV